MQSNAAARTIFMAPILGALIAGWASAQSYPVRPIRVLIPFAAGGGSDTTGRLVGGKMSESMGQQFLIDNRPGAGGNIATEALLKSPADGYTLMINGTGHTIQPHLSKVSWDPVKDFTPVSTLVVFSNVLVVNPAVPAKSVSELIAYAKANPGKLNYGSTGGGGPQHLAAELFKSMAGIDIVHIPYKGSAPQTAALLANDVQMVLDGLTTPLPHIKSGKLRALAVTGRRSQIFPDLPSIAEAGLRGYNYEGHNSFLAPGGMPEAIVERLHQEAVKALAVPEVHSRLISLGYEPVGSTPAQLGARIAADTTRFAKIVSEANIKGE